MFTCNKSYIAARIIWTVRDYTMQQCSYFVKQLRITFSIVRIVSKYNNLKSNCGCQENFTRPSTSVDLIPTNLANLQFTSSRESRKTFAARSRLCAFVNEGSTFELFTWRRRDDFPTTSVNAARHCRLSFYGSFHRREILRRRCADISAVTRRL